MNPPQNLKHKAGQWFEAEGARRDVAARCLSAFRDRIIVENQLEPTTVYFFRRRKDGTEEEIPDTLLGLRLRRSGPITYETHLKVTIEVPAGTIYFEPRLAVEMQGMPVREVVVLTEDDLELAKTTDCAQAAGSAELTNNAAAAVTRMLHDILRHNITGQDLSIGQLGFRFREDQPEKSRPDALKKNLLAIV